MKENKEISFVDEMNKEADEILHKLEADERLRDVRVTPEMDARMEARIRELEEQAEKDDASKNNIRRFPRKRKIWIALVAVCVLLLAIGTTSVGSKSYLKEMWDKRFGNNDVDVTSVADMESSETTVADEATVYREIRDKLGFDPVKPRVLPEKMYCEKYEIDEDTGLARVFYFYQEQVIQYDIYESNTDSSYSYHPTDELIETFLVDNGTQKIEVEEYQINETKQKRYYTTFEYMDVKYQLKGIMNRADFEKILKNLKYF
ncbi:MAG: DUF4367 domain-containing protein [Hespellia sp.]|nr:DUF4367 domain-containing protein [Hespellia sp.]